jgi:hypothetical protein
MHGACPKALGSLALFDHWVAGDKPTMDQLGTQRSMQLLPEMSNKLGSSVRDDGVGH